MRKVNNKRIVILTINIFLVIFWMLLVFLFSNQNSIDSSETSKSTIRLLLKTFSVDYVYNESSNLVESLQFITRKCAHFILYTIGGILIYNLINYYTVNIQYFSKNKKYKKFLEKYSYIVSVIIGLLYSITDEIHQLFIPGRSGEIRDVFIDTLGIILGTCMFMIVVKSIKAISFKKSIKIDK